MLDLVARLDTAAAKADLTQTDIARAMNVHPRTVARWMKRQAAPQPATRERILGLVAILEHLSTILQPQPAHDWLFTSNPLVDHCKPVDFLRAAESRRVLGALDAIAENAFV